MTSTAPTLVAPLAADDAAFTALRAACRAVDGADAFQHHPAAPDRAWSVVDAAGRLIAYAVAGRRAEPIQGARRGADAGVQAAVGVRPDWRRRGIGTALVAAVTASAPGAATTIWSTSPGPASDALALAADARVVRRLWRLQVGLPLARAVASPPVPSGYLLGAFDPADVDAIVDVNAAAFVALPDQAAMTAADVRARTRAPGFDPDGFVVASDRNGAIAGFCWTLRHPGERPGDDPHGEIYVIGVAPHAQGSGLGRVLCTAGFAHLARTCTTGFLYVDEVNIGARRLYHTLGMRIGRIDACYRIDAARS